MQLDPQVFLKLVEQTHSLVFFDLEATNLKGDFGSILCVSVKHYGKPDIITVAVDTPGRDRAILRPIKNLLEEANAWVGFYSKMFDIRMLNTRLLNWGMRPIEPRPHIDLYWVLRSHLALSRGNQGHILSWLQLPEQKMTVSAETWNKVLANPKKEMQIMVERCESDVKGLEALYERTKHLIKDIRL